MNYKAHIPAGVFLTGTVALAAGMPAVVPFLIGGAIGGALPDIDIEGSAVGSLGTKSAKTASRAMRLVGGSRAGRSLKPLTKIMGFIGLAIDRIFLKPITKAWLWLAENVLGKIYLAIYGIRLGEGTLGSTINWDSQTPWGHRGGLTHSFMFLLNSCIITVPIAFLIGGFPFWLGCEIGIISHLVTDSMCRSGVKFFWPFLIPIGFGDRSGGKVGDGVRILPYSLQVKTGAAQRSSQEIESITDEVEQKEARRLKFREKMWQWVFKLLAALVLVVLVIGVGPAPGGIAWSFDNVYTVNRPVVSQINQTSNQNQQTQSSQDNQQTVGGNSVQGENSNGVGNNVAAATGEDTQAESTVSDGSNSAVGVEGQTSTHVSGTTISSAQDGAAVAGVNPLGNALTASGSVPETEGPTSLTYGDVDLSELPRGIMKMPDESLWVVGVGPVNDENLNNPKWVFTDEEKEMLKRAAAAQRFEGIPKTAFGVANTAANGIGNALQRGADAAGNAANAVGNVASGAAEKGHSTILEWFQEVTGIGLPTGSGSYDGGFLGITPYT